MKRCDRRESNPWPPLTISCLLPQRLIYIAAVDVVVVALGDAAYLDIAIAVDTATLIVTVVLIHP